jgi:hypothetical protein
MESMTDMERGLRQHGSWAAPLAATVVVLACTAFLRFQGGVGPPSPRDFAVDSAGGRPYLAVIVAQAADCKDGTRYLGVFCELVFGSCLVLVCLFVVIWVVVV